MVEQTTHIFDLARVLAGEATSVYAVGARRNRPAFQDSDVCDVSVATLSFASGAIVPMASTCLLHWPHRIGLHLFCEGLAIELSEFELMIDVGQGRPVRRAEGDPFVREDRAFIDAVQGKPNHIRAPYAEALRTHRLTTAAAQASPPPLIEHGGLVGEALAGPKHLTTRYVGVCTTIRDAAASRMPDRGHHALAIPSMVDLNEFDPAQRNQVRRAWGVRPDVPVVGWVGRLDRKKRVEDFVRAAAIVHRRYPPVRFVVVGCPDAFMPEYADELQALACDLQLQDVLHFLGDRPDVPRQLAGLDIFTWLSRGEGMPHVIGEAGAAGLPVIATRDDGSEEQTRTA